MSKTKFRQFKKPIKVGTINDNLFGYAFRRKEELLKVTDEALIKEWQYCSIANVYVRYRSLFKPYKRKIHHQRVMQLGGEDYRKLLAEELDRRNILELADDSFGLSFVSSLALNK